MRPQQGLLSMLVLSSGHGSAALWPPEQGRHLSWTQRSPSEPAESDPLQTTPETAVFLQSREEHVVGARDMLGGNCLERGKGCISPMRALGKWHTWAHQCCGHERQDPQHPSLEARGPCLLGCAAEGQEGTRQAAGEQAWLMPEDEQLPQTLLAQRHCLTSVGLCREDGAAAVISARHEVPQEPKLF